MPKYNVAVTVEEVIEVEADSWQEAEKIALEMFDPTAHDPVIAEIWTDDE